MEFRIKTDEASERVLASSLLFGDALHRCNFSAIFNYGFQNYFLTKQQTNSSNYTLNYDCRTRLAEVYFEELDNLFLELIPDNYPPVRYVYYQPGMLYSENQLRYLVGSLGLINSLGRGAIWSVVGTRLIDTDYDHPIRSRAFILCKHLTDILTGNSSGPWGHNHHLVPDASKLAYDMSATILPQLSQHGCLEAPQGFQNYDYENNRLFYGYYPESFTFTIDPVCDEVAA